MRTPWIDNPWSAVLASSAPVAKALIETHSTQTIHAAASLRRRLPTSSSRGARVGSIGSEAIVVQDQKFRFESHDCVFFEKHHNKAALPLVGADLFA